MDTIRSNRLDLLTFSSFPTKSVSVFTTTIEGGISTGAYASLNLSSYSGDDADCVSENQERLADEINVSIENLYIPYQTHNDQIRIIDNDFLIKSDLEKAKSLNGIDALITNQKDICIGVTTADCVPILIFDPVQHVLAAIHAGWKGTVARIAEKTIEKMTEHFDSKPQDLVAGIGPCISQKHFEVGDEVVDAFIQTGFTITDIAYHNTESGKMHINLELANKLLLIEAGIDNKNIEVANLCTYSHPELFFSARRQTINSGRILTGGVLK